MDYLEALAYSSWHEDPDAIRRKLNLVQQERARLTDELDRVPPGPEREIIWRRRVGVHRRMFALEWRLQRAEEFAVYDWEQGEREFINWLGDGVLIPGRVDELRKRGVPLRVLWKARRLAEGLT